MIVLSNPKTPYKDTLLKWQIHFNRFWRIAVSKSGEIVYANTQNRRILNIAWPKTDELIQQFSLT